MTSSVDGSEEILRLKTLCLAHSQVKLPKADEHAALLFNGLGKFFFKFQFYKYRKRLMKDKLFPYFRCTTC